jgi:hypothetical protein
MSSINPFSGYVGQAASVEQTQAVEKSRQVRRSAELSKKLATRDDEMEHQVESSDEIVAIHDEQGSQQQDRPRQQQTKGEDEEEPPRLDVTA